MAWRALLLANHWLLLANVAMLAFILPTLLAPYLASVGAYWPSRMIYLFYRLTCHQRPERSLFLFGHKMAICARCTAIYTSFWGLGLLYSVWKATPWGRRHRPRSLPIKWLAVLAVPMFIDGVAQHHRHSGGSGNRAVHLSHTGRGICPGSASNVMPRQR
jgi:uncharacterized membrane protein